MNAHGYMYSCKTGDIFAIRMGPNGAVVSAFGPIKAEETVPWEVDKPFAYSKSVGALIEGNRGEFEIIYLEREALGYRTKCSPQIVSCELQEIEA